MNDNYTILLQKLDEFIRKYYRNQLIKGLILFFAVLFISVLIFTTAESVGHFNSSVRTLLFYLFLILNAGVAGFFIFVPLLKLARIGKIITHEQAAWIIGKYFDEVSDKLLNILQLKHIYDSGGENIVLIKAGIDQKISQIKLIPFVKAIDIRKNRKFLRYALPPLLIILLLLGISPAIITRPTERIINHSKIYIEEMPFNLSIQNNALEAYQQEDFVLKVKATGDKLPDELFLEKDGVSFKMNKESKILFSYTFKTLQKTEIFRLSTGNFNTPEYELKVFPRPVILNYQVDLTYPRYTNRKAESLENTGDLIIPEGTSVKWTFFTKDVDNVSFVFDTTGKTILKKNSNAFEYAAVFNHSMRYSVKAENKWAKKPDSLAYNLTVIPDAYPVISVKEVQDSSVTTRLFFQGTIKDDWGFSALTFHYTLFYNGDTTQKESHSEAVALSKNLNQQSFYYSLDIRRYTQNPGDALEYYFEVCDNDEIHGPKCARTGLFQYKTPTLAELGEMTDKQEQTISKDLEQSVKEAKQIQKQIEDLNRRLIDKNTLSWQDKKQIEDLLEKQEKIKEDIDKILKENTQKNELEQQYKEIDPSIIEKQQQLNQLFNEVMDDEMKKMIEEMRKLLDKVDKNQVNDMLEKMKFNNKDLEKQLDRSLDVFKQIEFEKKLSESIDVLKKLSDKQDKLAESTSAKEKSQDQLSKEQDELNKEFDELSKDLKELEQKNKELEDPADLPEMDQKKDEISQDMKDSQQKIDQGKMKESSKSQKNASKKMQDLSAQLENAQEGMESGQEGEDAEKLRAILENLIRVSFDQEDLMKRTRNINRNDPKYLTLTQQQNDLKDDISMIEDSLYAVARRQVMIKPFIMREAAAINQNIGAAVKGLNDRNIAGTTAKQQFVMTSVNNLALMLNEALQQMESNMQMQSKSKGNGSCSKPGGKGKGKMSMKTMRQMQENLNKQLQQLKDGQKSNSPGQGKEGTTGQKGMSEKLARLAAQQEAIRSQMKKYADQLNEEGNLKEGSGMNNTMQEMEKTEKDLINKRILQETIDRQQKILTRMLESEKAEQQREQEERRKSTEAKDQKFSNPSTDFQYNKLKSQSTDLLRTSQPAYNYFYKNKINGYFLKFEK